MSREYRDAKEKTERIKRPKMRFMFSIPKDVLTDDIKNAQNDAIHAYVFMKSSIQTKADKEIIDKSYDAFKDKMLAYAESIIGAMKKQEKMEKKETEEKEEVKKVKENKKKN